MAKSNVHQLRPVGAEPTPEALELQAKRAFLQKRNALAEQILLSQLQGGASAIDSVVERSVEAADLLMQKLYGVEVKPEAPAE